MKLELSGLAEELSPSPTLAVDAKAKALIAAGEDVCGFGPGEPDFDTPEFIKEACIKALRDGKTKYINVAGLPELRTALVSKYKEDNKLSIKAEQVVVSPGGKLSCLLAILATCNAGDEVIIPTPYWVSYPEMLKFAGAKAVFIETSDKTNFKITPDQFKEAITPKTKLFILNSPSNPTGMVYTRKELEAIAAVALEHGVYIMSDEIYEYLLYGKAEHHSPASFSAEMAELVITVSGFSKSFSMTGWRLGTLVANERIAKAVAKIQGQMTSNATTFAQYGALAALENKAESKKAIDGMVKVFNERRLMMLKGLRSIPGVECLEAEAAFYLFPKIASFGMSSTDFATKLLEEEKVALVPGMAFGTDDYVRLSYATSNEIINKGLERLGRFCQRLG
ncbi:MAG: aspartate aminotransferase [Verrucomicrobia bacterium CG1_02_43_26]|nr:MAG: aspartate aminotransferase [Verrucomicrobia bacterium CG1_02_43_26]